MSALLWVDTPKGVAIDLGSPLRLLGVFAEMERVAGDAYDEFADLFGVPDATMEDGEDVEPEWLADVQRQAVQFLTRFKAAGLSEDAVAVLEDLAAGPPDGAAG